MEHSKSDTKCKTCDGEGWIAQIIGTNRIQIHKCDTCNVFSCDDEAVGYVILEYGRAKKKADAYPKLVEALDACVTMINNKDIVANSEVAVNRAKSLLEELGESLNQSGCR